MRPHENRVGEGVTDRNRRILVVLEIARSAAIVARMPGEDDLHIDPEKIDAAVQNERDRIVGALRRFADRLESAPIGRVSEGLAWVASAVESLGRTVERAIGREK